MTFNLAVPTYDVLVLGGGTAGCVMAARLSEDPLLSVCLVEAGPDHGAFGAASWPADLLDARRLPTSHDWNYEGGRSSSRARVIGGCSAHNACAVVWGSREDYDEWAPWSFDVLEPFLSRAQATLGTRGFDEAELTPWHAALLDAAAAAGLPRLGNLNDLDATAGIAPFPLNARGGTRWNTAFAYLDPARKRSNLTVIAAAVCDRVVVANGRAVGALVGGSDIRARLVIVTAGAYATPAILLRSGIGPPGELHRHGIELVADLPVGEGLVDHPGVGLGWAPNPELDHAMRARDEADGFFEAQLIVRGQSRSCEPGTWDLHLLPWIARADGRAEGYEATCVAYALKPRSRGSVRLRSRDPRDGPAIDHGFLADESDADVVEDGVELMRRIVRREPVARLARTEVRPGDADLRRYVRENVRGIFHPVATCGLGSVVDGNGAVLGVPGLHIADASVLPTIPRANTNLSVAAVAELLSERVAALV